MIMAMQTKGGISKKIVKPFGSGKKTMNKNDKATVDKDAKRKKKGNK